MIIIFFEVTGGGEYGEKREIHSLKKENMRKKEDSKKKLIILSTFHCYQENKNLINLSIWVLFFNWKKKQKSFAIQLVVVILPYVF